MRHSESAPDYHSTRGAVLVSIHETLEGASNSLYHKCEGYTFRQVGDVWIGPDGFGEIRKLKVLP